MPIIPHQLDSEPRLAWFYKLLGEGGEEFAELGHWDRREASERSPADLGHGLEATWQGMHQAIPRWMPEDWVETYPDEYPEEPEVITRQWVIWHLIEHDLHHGGEISLTLGAQDIPAIDL
jgi:uncharacterized damage-inducible protein DinB